MLDFKTATHAYMPSTVLDLRKEKEENVVPTFLGAYIPSKPIEKSTLYTILSRSQPQQVKHSKPTQNYFQFLLPLFFTTVHLLMIRRVNAEGKTRLSNIVLIFANRYGENCPCAAVGLAQA